MKKLGKLSYVFQQDSAPAHTATSVQSWMGKNMNFWPKDFWPLQSPDLNPLDYSIWWHVESKACRVQHNSIADLKSSVEMQWKNMNRAYVSNMCAAFHGSLEAVLAADGSQIHK